MIFMTEFLEKELKWLFIFLRDCLYASASFKTQLRRYRDVIIPHVDIGFVYFNIFSVFSVLSVFKKIEILIFIMFTKT